MKKIVLTLAVAMGFSAVPAYADPATPEPTEAPEPAPTETASPAPTEAPAE